VLLVIGLSSLAAFLFALAASLQQHEAHQAGRAIEAGVRRRAFLLALAHHLPRRHLWLLGWLVNLAGFFAQGAALYFGSVALVQVLLVTQLIFALPLATAWARRWPRRLDWFSGAAICAGVIVFVATHGGSARGGDADRQAVVVTVLGAAVLVAVLVRAAASRSPLMAAALIAVAAGLCFATSAALMKLTADDLVLRGVSATARDWPGYTLAVTAFTGVVLGQWAFATGSLPTAVAATTITNPVASYVIAILAFHASPAATAPRIAGIVTAAALICLGVVGLAHSTIVRTP
jgi:drug/metabolite transporter (DMT)-like permease